MDKVDSVLDGRGLKCPMPVLRARKALDAMASGQVLEVVATDPGSMADFQAFCRNTGHALVSSAQNGAEYVYRIRKK